jgi:hypothetical protein
MSNLFIREVWQRMSMRGREIEVVGRQRVPTAGRNQFLKQHIAGIGFVRLYWYY